MCSSSRAMGRRRTCLRRGPRARVRHEGRLVSGDVCERGEARRLQPRRSHVGHAHAPARGHSRQSRPAALLQGMRSLVDRLEPITGASVDEIIPSQLSYSGFQAVLKLLLSDACRSGTCISFLKASRESRRTCAGGAARRACAHAHGRSRSAAISPTAASQGSAARQPVGSCVPPGLEARCQGRSCGIRHRSTLIEQFGQDASKAIRAQLDQGHQFVLVSAPDARPYVRMVTERLFPTLPCFRISKSRAASRFRRWARSRDHTHIGDGVPHLPRVLQGWKLHHADAGLWQSAHPAQVRLFLAVSTTLALAPFSCLSSKASSARQAFPRWAHSSCPRFWPALPSGPWAASSCWRSSSRGRWWPT